MSNEDYNDSKLEWIGVLKTKIVKIDGIVEDTLNSLTEVEGETNKLLRRIIELCRKNNIENSFIEEVNGDIKHIFEKIKRKQLSQKKEITEAKELSEKSISYIRSFYEKTTRDSMTGLYNKEYIYNMLEVLLENKNPFIYSFIDLNNLKKINDNYGHQSGDELIKIFAKNLSLIFGNKDNYIARVQGDEFAIISFLSYKDFLEKIKKLEKWFENKKITINSPDGKKVPVKLEFGYGITGSMEAEDVETLIHLADKRMYKNKYEKKK